MPRKKKVIESEGEYPDTESEGEEDIKEEDNKPEEIKQEIKPIKTKKPISEERKQHLDQIRVKALEAKRKQKELTLKAKLLKTVEKEDAAKKYDDYIAAKQQQQPIPQPIQQPTPQPQPKRERKVKKIIYESDEEDENLDHLLYMDNKKKLHERVLNERIKSSILGYQNALMPQRY